MEEKNKCDEIRQLSLKWFRVNGRKFYWRTHTSPYTILITEILLKKTTAGVVNQFLPLFLKRYPAIQKLNKCSLLNVQIFLAPLGLSEQRAIQFKGLAKVLVDSYGGNIPCNKDELLTLPGIGDYTAGAILSFAFRMPEAIVDTNIARLFIRLFGLTPSRCEARRSPEVWDKAKQLVHSRSKQIAKINWALIDLGALVCKPHTPKCNECPLSHLCEYVVGKAICF
jgi:A/G-specific adenine glycosylase